MKRNIIGALVSKDLALFYRNRFFAIVTVLGLAVYLALYFFLPKTVDETLTMGIYAPALPESFQEVFQQDIEQGLVVSFVDSEEELKNAVVEGDYLVGIVLPEDMQQKLAAGEKPQVTLYTGPDVPSEVVDIFRLTIDELAFRQVGQPLDVELDTQVLGPDLLGIQVAPRDRMRPMLASLIILFEMMGLANLISEEAERGTLRALLVTPVRVKDLFISKGIVGVGLAFGQALLFIIIVGGLSHQPVLILLTLFLGAVLATGLAFLIASLGKDFLSVLAWSMAIFIILFIPAFGVMFPGTVTEWVKIIPSYYLVDTVHRVSNFGAGWADMTGNLLILLGIDIVLVWVGILALRRKTG